MPPQQLKAANSDSGKASSLASTSTDLPVTAHDREPAALFPLANDLLRGAAEIAEFIFGNPRHRRAVYHLAVEVKPESRMPIFRLGSVLCARRSTLLRWIAEQEASVWPTTEGAIGPSPMRPNSASRGRRWSAP
jgi:hypothetical protein